MGGNLSGMSDIKNYVKKIIKFRDARDWKQFHNPKDMALSLTLEASEVAEHFLWKNEKEIEEYVKKHRQDIGEELADALYCVMLLAHDLNIDIIKVAEKKLLKNAKKYPVKKAKGNHLKYTDL